MCLTAPTTAEPLARLTKAMTRERIGFEFETDLAIRYENNGELVYQTVLFERRQGDKLIWSIIVDGISENKRAAVMEFKTEPLSGVQELYDCIMDMALFALQVGERVARAKALPLSFANVAIELDAEAGLKPAGRALLLTGGSSDGAPQVTIGIALCNMAQTLCSAERFPLTEFGYNRETVAGSDRLFLNQMNALPGLRGSAESDGPTNALEWGCQLEQALLNQPDGSANLANFQIVPITAGYREGETAGPPAPDLQRKVRDAYASAGLMALTLTYLNAGWYVLGRVSYSKSVFPVMARNSFAALYGKLDRTPAFTAERAIERFGLDDDQLKTKRVFQSGFEADLRPPLDQGNDRAVTQIRNTGRISVDHPTDFGPRIQDWLRSISNASLGKSAEGCQYYDKALNDLHVGTAGHDLLSHGSVRYSSVSLGALQPVSINTIPFALVEFREWPKASLAPTLWISLATRLFEFYDLHSGACADYPTPWVARANLLWYYQDLQLKRSADARRGFHYTPGNCLFDSVGYLLRWEYTIERTAGALRKLTADEIREHPESYFDFIAREYEGEDWVALIKRAAAYLEVDRNWEDDVADLAVVALARALKRQGIDVAIRLFGTDGRPIQTLGSGMIVLQLLYNGIDHYAPWPVSGAQVQPAQDGV